ALGHALSWENDPYWTYWITKTFLIATVTRSEQKLAEDVRTPTLALVEQSGFADYFLPLDGEAVGAEPFAWTQRSCPPCSSASDHGAAGICRASTGCHPATVTVTLKAALHRLRS